MHGSHIGLQTSGLFNKKFSQTIKISFSSQTVTGSIIVHS